MTAHIHRRPAGWWRPVLAIGATAVPALAFWWLLANPRRNLELPVPVEHFVIVTLVSLLALVVALLVARAATQIEQYRVLFLALGFMSMAGLFAVHGLATPGVILPASDGGYGGSVVGLSAFLSLFVASLFFAASYSRVAAPLQRGIPFHRGALEIAVTAAVAIYGALAVWTPRVLETLPLSSPPYSYGLAVMSVLLFLAAAWRQTQAWLATRLPLQGALVIAFLLLAQAQVAMVLGPVWTLGWWEYHLLMLAAVGLALGTLLNEYRAGQSLRLILEGALELQVDVGVEIENVDTIAALAAATEAKDPQTKGHTVRVAEVAVAIGRELGLPHAALRVLARAGLLHDIGKLGIPDAILLKPGPLTPEEKQIMDQHPVMGLDILARVGKLRREAEVLAAHHERMDGTGYPRGLAGEEIPLEARVVAVADVFDALVSDRPYRKGLPRAEAMRIIEESTGSHLYPPAVAALQRILASDSLPEPVGGVYRQLAAAPPP
ncbi:MAG: HD-GYP domain-containing protein [Chloroflexi bacterium]|nr:HD-GYP domain-containing protein [Chloroflexota bacterium]